MKRRDFISTVGLGSLAAGSISGLNSCNSLNNVQEGVKDENPGEKEILRKSGRVRSGIALGGIGTGWVEIRKDGNFHNWTIFNNAPCGHGPVFHHLGAPVYGYDNDRNDANMFFTVRYKVGDEQPWMKVLSLSDGISEGGLLHYAKENIFPWLSPVQKIESEARFPFTRFTFTDPDMPFVIEMEAFSPFIPNDIKNSSLPGAYFNFKVKSLVDQPVEMMLIGSMRNMVGYDTHEKYFKSGLAESKGYKLFSHEAGMDKRLSSHGNMSLASLSGDSTYYLGWAVQHPYFQAALLNNQLPCLDDTDGVKDDGNLPRWMPVTNGRNHVDEETGKKVASTWQGEQVMFSSIAKSHVFRSRDEQVNHGFVMSWYFPNNYVYEKKKRDVNERILKNDFETLPENVGHYYMQHFTSSAEVAKYMIKNQALLEGKTRGFFDDFYASEVDGYILNQVNSHFNTLITNTTLTRDKRYGVMDEAGLNHPDGRFAVHRLNLDVNVYGSILGSSLFSELQKIVMIGMKNRQKPDGMIGSKRSDWPSAYVEMSMREYFWSNDKSFLKEVWPAIKKVIDFALNELDNNGNEIPNIAAKTNGCSYDNLPMYGTASYVTSQWMSALRHAIEGAKAMNDQEAEEKYTALLARVSRKMDQLLWNGKYYRLYNDTTGDKGKNEGCLTDQLFGQWTARLSGLGYLVDRDKLHQSMKSILEMNENKGFNLEICSWPDDKHFFVLPDYQWVDQMNVAWSGVEVAFSSFLIYEGMVEEGLRVLKAVDDRYRENGLYWSHQEAGGHYARPMAAWANINALLGLEINQGTYSFAPKIGKQHFKMIFAFAGGWAHFIQEAGEVKVDVRSGIFKLHKLVLEGKQFANLEGKVIVAGSEMLSRIEREGEKLIIDFMDLIHVKEGEQIIIS